MTRHRERLQTAYFAVSGPRANECTFLGQRFPQDEDFSPGRGESWVLSSEPGDDGEAVIRLVQGSSRRLNGIWRAPSGRIYLVDHTGRARRADAPGAGSTFSWTEDDLGTSLLGVWGLDDSFVLAWGMRRLHEWTMHRFDGARWAPMPSPDMFVHAVHGSRLDDVWAVGWDGKVARWDGSEWRPFPTPVHEALSSVFSAGPDEVYAVGVEGSLLEGSDHGWIRVGEGPRPFGLTAVAKWRGELWLGADAGGLCRRVGTTSRIEVVKPNVPARGFDARSDLVIVTRDEIVGTADGETFVGFGLESLAELRAGHALMEW
ncbi:MAG: hypothetical protein IT379_05945 [Deltaproteobacteria bacterium]|nr:hypothetical protein [Deltaproteobacteria bacterium]